MNVNFKKHTDVLPGELTDICTLKDMNWSYGYDRQKKWIGENIDENDVHVLMYTDESLAGYCNLVWRSVSVAGRTLSVLGIGNVCVAPSYKNLKLGSALMAEVNKFLIDNHHHGILLCKDALVGFYLKSQWILIDRESVSADYDLADINVMSFNFHVQDLYIHGKPF